MSKNLPGANKQTEVCKGPCSAVKKKTRLLTDPTIGVNLNISILHERGQTTQSIHCMIPFEYKILESANQSIVIKQLRLPGC